MSVPPYSPPPGGNYYNAPPPPANNSNGCLKAAGITCGVLVLLGVIIGIIGVVAVKKQLAHPDKSSPFGVVVIVAKATPDGVAIHQAIVSYHNKTGKYPNKLEDLVPDYLPDGKKLHNDLDPNPSPGHVTWKYTKPQEGADGKTPLLSLPYEVTVANSGGKQTQHAEVIINLDGSSGSNTSTTYDKASPAPSSSQ